MNYKSYLKYSTVWLSLVFALGLQGCEDPFQGQHDGPKGHDSGPGDYGNRDYFDDSAIELFSMAEGGVSHAKGVFIAPTDESDDEELQVIDENDKRKKIKIGHHKNKIKPLAIFNTPKYVVLNYDRNGHPRPKYHHRTCSIVLMKKSNGSLYCVDSQLHCGQWDNCHSNTVQANQSGDLIYIGKDFLEKIDMSGSSPSLTQVVNTELDGHVEQFSVNSRGDALVIMNSTDYAARYSRIYRNTGRVISINTGWGLGCPMSGPDSRGNNFFYVDNNERKIYELNDIGGTYIETLYYDYPWYQRNRVDLGYLDCYGDDVFAKTDSKIYYRSKWDNKLIELVNENNQPYKMNVNAFEKFTKIKGRNDRLVIVGIDTVGNHAIVEYVPSELRYYYVLRPGSYLFYGIDISYDGNITFSGMRASDGIRVLAEIPNDQRGLQVLYTQFPKVTQIYTMQ